MFYESFKELERMSKAVGALPEYVQGGGGNTSVKIDEMLMAVKASGYKLKDITTKDGFVVVNYQNIKNYFNEVDFSSEIDYEKDSIKFTKDNVVKIEELQDLRPSVEAGFHSILKKYVIHTHPVYANIICCSTEGQSLLKKIFPQQESNILWIPYINPGFFLTVKIKEGLEKCKEKGVCPEIIFMENHGFIVHSDDLDKCVKIHNDINNSIKEYFEIEEIYPKIEIIKAEGIDSDAKFISNTLYLKNFFKNKEISKDLFERFALYPDQLVYLNDSVSLNGEKNKLNINTSKGELLYYTSYNEAITIEETLLGYIYVIDNIEKNKLKVKSMSTQEVDYIRNWESEKYRKNLAK